MATLTPSQIQTIKNMFATGQTSSKGVSYLRDDSDRPATTDGKWIYVDSLIYSVDSFRNGAHRSGYRYVGSYRANGLSNPNYHVPVSVYTGSSNNGVVCFLDFPNVANPKYGYIGGGLPSSDLIAGVSVSGLNSWIASIPSNLYPIADSTNILVGQGLGSGFWILCTDTLSGFSYNTWNGRAFVSPGSSFNNKKLVAIKLSYKTLEVMRQVTFMTPSSFGGSFGSGENGGGSMFEVNGVLIVPNAGAGHTYYMVDLGDGSVLDSFSIGYVGGETNPQNTFLDYWNGWIYKDGGDTSYGSDDGWRLVRLTNLHVEVEVSVELTVSSTVKRTPLLVTGKVFSSTNAKVAYRIMVNGVQYFPQSGYTTFAQSPVYVVIDIPHVAFNVGSNTITLDAISDTGSVDLVNVLVTKVNSNPDVVLNLAENPVHENNAILLASVSDIEGDDVAYQIHLNGNQVYPATGWTAFSMTPFDVSYYFQNGTLLEGTNTILFKLLDSEGGSSSRTITVSKVNNAPTIENGEVKGLTVMANIKDSDRDKVKYRILVGGTKVYPETDDWSVLLPTPFNVRHDIPINLFVPGNTYMVRIEAEDHLGKPAMSWSTSALIDYAGLMFTDETGSYYSTHIGDVIKCLDMGTIVAGDVSSVYKVFLKNTSATKYTNIVLSTDQGDLDPVEEKVEISKDNAPFDPQTTLDFPGVTLDYGDSVYFYVRVNTTRRALGGGKFKIWVSGDPVL